MLLLVLMLVLLLVLLVLVLLVLRLLVLTISPAGFFKVPPSSKLLASAAERYTALTFPHKTSAATLRGGAGATAGAVTGLTIKVADLAEDYPQSAPLCFPYLLGLLVLPLLLLMLCCPVDCPPGDPKPETPCTSHEEYTLDVSAAGEATLTAPTVWAALRGLETFSQVRPLLLLLLLVPMLLLALLLLPLLTLPSRSS